jgi:hypothetical protein
MLVSVRCVQWVGDLPTGAPNVKHVTKENLVPMKAVNVKIVQKKHFKTQVKVNCAVVAQQDGTNPMRVHEHASVQIINNHPTATMFSTSTIPPPTLTVGTASNAPLVPPALETSIGTVSNPNLDGQDATTTTLPLNVVLFQRLV